jgi:hypothetical protein
MKLPLMAAALVCMAFLLPVAGLAQVGQQESNQDQRILREVRQILANEHAFDGMSISSSVHHGIVTLDGTVSSQAAKVLASTEIENVDGIKSVMNNLNVVGGAPRPTTAAPSGAIENKNLILPYGSILPVRITDEINSKTAHANDLFHGTIATDVIANGYVMLPAGTPLQGRVVEAKPAGHLVGSAVLTIELTRLTVKAPEGPRLIGLTVQPLSSKAQGRGTNTAEKAGGGAAVGALIGALAVGGRGAAIGAASGGALGTGVNAVTRGNEIIVRPEQLLQFRMNQAALVPITLKDGHQVPPVPAPAASLDKATE